MSLVIKKSPDARMDLVDLFVYIGQHDQEAADRFLRAVDQTIEKLAAMPGLGGPCELDNPNLADLKVWPVKGFKKYLIFYRLTDEGIEIVRVLYGGRDISKLLEE